MFKFSALTVTLVLVALTLALERVVGWHAIRRGFNPRWPCGTYCRYNSKCIIVNRTLTSSTVIERVLNFVCVFAVDYKDSDEYPYY
jgi:hypothetical protein